MAVRYCLVTGSGDLVTQVVRVASARNVPLTILSLAGQTSVAGQPAQTFDPHDLDGLFAAVRASGATHIALAGYVSMATWEALHKHPALRIPAGMLAGTAELAKRLEAALPELTGARLAGIPELAPELLVPNASIAGPALTEAWREHALSALRKARELGWRDVGQAVVRAPTGEFEAEDMRGTDALLSRIATQREGQAQGDLPWVLAKALKPQQPLSMDVPVIGPATIENARRAGISVIALEAGGTVIVDRPMVEKAALDAGISVVGMAF